MPSYLVEVYLPRSLAHEVRATGRRARAAAEQLSREGIPIHYVRTTYLPDDETCFHHFEAHTPAAVEEASRRAALGRARIAPTIEVSHPCVGAEIEANRRSRTACQGDAGPPCRMDYWLIVVRSDQQRSSAAVRVLIFHLCTESAGEQDGT